MSLTPSGSAGPERRAPTVYLALGHGELFTVVIDGYTQRPCRDRPPHPT